MRVAVAGSGGMGREALAWLRDARPDVEAVAFFVAGASERPTGNQVDLPLVTSVEDLAALDVSAIVLAIGEGAVRRRVGAEAAAASLTLLSIVHPAAFLGPGVDVGPSAIVAPGAVLTRDVRLAAGAIVNFRAAIGHDCAVGDFAFIGPGAVLAGDVTVGAGAMVGAGAVVLPGRTVGDRGTVGAGAVVTHDVPAGSVVVGNPARPRPSTKGGLNVG
jgi:UDP-perosamine 4-acetyltransferase